MSDTRDRVAAENFFSQAEKTTGITNDKEPALAAVTDNIFGNGTTRKYLNNHIEANHCDTKGRINVVRSFKDIFSAMQFRTVFEEVRHFFRMGLRRTQGTSSLVCAQQIYILFCSLAN